MTQSAADICMLLAFFAVLVIVIWLFNPGNFLAWCREEWRLARADTWEGGVYRGAVGTAADPDVKQMVVRQRAFGKRLRRQGRSLLGPEGKRKAYTPELTKPAPESPPPRADQVVVPLRRVS